MPRLASNARICRASVSLGDVAPTEFRVFKYGLNEASGGDFVFDERSAKLIEKQLRQEFSADFEHQALETPAVQAPASAWFNLELRDDGLWAVNVRWTKRAKEMIEAKEYRFFSPAFQVEDAGDGLVRVSEMINLALTNLPAMRNLQPLIAANRKGVLKMSLAVGKKVTLAEDVEADDSIKAQTGTIVRQSESGGFMVKFDSMEEPVEYSEEQLIEAAEDVEEEEEVKVPVQQAQEGEPMADEEKKPEEMKKSFKSSILKLTRAANEDQALGLVLAWKESHSKVKQLSDRIAILEAEKEVQERDALIQKCVDAGKLAPKDEGMKAWLCSLSIEGLKGYLENAPAISKEPVKLRQDNSANTVLALTEKQQKMIKQLGVTQEQLFPKVSK